jgi:hypothetical protein
MTIEKMFLM